MKILIAPDKFKGTLSAKQVCEAIAAGLEHRGDAFDITFHPMADGGDGSLQVLKDHLGLKERGVNTQDPLGRALTTSYFTSEDAAFIEVASASGLVLLTEAERNPLRTSTLGTGKMIVNAIEHGYQNIYLFLGGSATNDAGMGIAQALGFQFLDVENKLLPPTGGSLPKVASIKNQQLFDFSEIKITLFYDVANPLFGKYGAAYVYAPQKGATGEQVQYLDEGLIHICKLLEQHTGINVSEIPGSGAAGGIGAGLIALCGAQMSKGFTAIAELTRLDDKIQQADWVISGEGRLDEQSLQGKVIDGIADLCHQYQKPLSLFVGKNELPEDVLADLNIKGVFSIMDTAENTKDAMRNGSQYLETLAREFSAILE